MIYRPPLLEEPFAQTLLGKITTATFMQLFQYDLLCSAAKDISTAHAATPLQHLDAAITMRFATSRRQPASLYAHGNTTWQHSCSHSTAIFNPRFQITLHLHACKHSQSSLSNLKRQFHCGKKHQNDLPATVAHSRYLSSPAGATLPGKTQGFVPQLPPKTKPVQHHCSSDVKVSHRPSLQPAI